VLWFCVHLRDAFDSERQVCVCVREKVSACVKNKKGTIGTKRQKACCGVTCVRAVTPP